MDVADASPLPGLPNLAFDHDQGRHRALPLREGWQALHDLHRLQADRGHLADQAHDVLRVIGAIGIVDDAAALVGADLVLIDNPVQG